MIYDGVLSQLLDIEMAEMEKALRRQLGKKPKAIELNMAALQGRVRLRRASTSPSSDPFWRRADEQDRRA